MSTKVTAFRGPAQLAAGPLPEVAAALHRMAAPTDAMILVFDDATGRLIDLDLSGSSDEPGRALCRRSSRHPLPRAAENSASPRKRSRCCPGTGTGSPPSPAVPRPRCAALSKSARRTAQGSETRRPAQDAAYRVMQALAGDAPGYEEALRALYADDPAGFDQHSARWPDDVRRYCRALGFPARVAD